MNKTSKLRISKRGYHRKGYRRKDGTYVKPTHVSRTTYLAKGRGKKGRTPKNKQWFNPKDHTGWSKIQPATTRRRKLLAATDKRKSMHDRYVEAGRKAQALANVTVDKRTKELASLDARYFFRKSKNK